MNKGDGKFKTAGSSQPMTHVNKKNSLFGRELFKYILPA